MSDDFLCAVGVVSYIYLLQYFNLLQKTTAVILNEPRLLIFNFAYSVSNLFTPLRLSLANDIAVIIAMTAVAIISANTFGSTCTANR